MKVISLQVPSALYSQLAAAARKRKVSKSAVVREALAAHLNGQQKPFKGSFYEAAKHLIGSVDSGVGDLSTNPKHMDGFGK